MTNGHERGQNAADPLAHPRRMQVILADLCLEAMNFSAKAKVEETVRQWLSRTSLDPEDPQSAEMIAEALLLALELATFTPAMSGARPVDRLARQRQAANQDETTALAALKRASFRLLRVRSITTEDLFCAEDLATGEMLSLFDDGLPPAAMGVTLAARLCPLADGIFVTVGPMTPLDEAALGVALGFVRPGKGLVNEQRCAAAVYRHVIRHGAPKIPGVNDMPENDPLPPTEESDLDALAWLWAELGEGVTPPPASVEAARCLTSGENLLQALLASLAAGRGGKRRLAAAYRRLAALQMETLQRRASAGTGDDPAPLETIAAALEQAVAEKRYPGEAAELFRDLRRRLSAEAGPKRTDADLTRVIERIQALRAKTVEQGCTEQEALAAANKMAELLDRYGLSLSEIELRRQPCQGIGIDTERRRHGPLDRCVPAIATFCDCKVWTEKTATGTIRYVFFGLPADVEAAHYLYDLVTFAFDTETASFKSGAIYAEMAGGHRRTAVNSFQIGLSRGLSAKLDALKAERAAQKSTGRDLVPLKTSIIDEELAKLGLSFHAQGQKRGRRVLAEAYEAGHVAGRKFEVRAGLQ